MSRGRVRPCPSCGDPRSGAVNHDGCTGLPFPPGTFPGAAYATEAEAPSRCPRPGCGGLLRRVEEGVACRLCGRHFVVSEILQRTLRHGIVFDRPAVSPLLGMTRRWAREADSSS